MADEWACDECGYITTVEPSGGKCPGCGSKMSKIEGIDDQADGDKEYDEDALATTIDDDKIEMSWDDDKEEH